MFSTKMMILLEKKISGDKLTFSELETLRKMLQEEQNDIVETLSILKFTKKNAS